MKNFSLQFLQTELNRTSDWIRSSDTKCSLLAVYYSTIFGLLFSQGKLILADLVSYQNWVSCAYFLLLLGTIIMLYVGVFFLFQSIFPQLKNISGNNSLFYFGYIASIKYADYLKGINEMMEDEAKKQLAEQIHTNSVIANEKMKNIQKSTKALFYLIILSILLILFTVIV